jgi:hypothetical protein
MPKRAHQGASGSLFAPHQSQGSMEIEGGAEGRVELSKREGQSLAHLYHTLEGFIPSHHDDYR